MNHPGVHGERETKGTVTLPKLTSAMLQTAGPPKRREREKKRKERRESERERSAFKTLRRRENKVVQNSQKLYSRGWDGHRKHRSIDVDISTGEWREKEQRERGRDSSGECCID